MRRLRDIAACLTVLMHLAGCATLHPPLETANPPHAGKVRDLPAHRPAVALALSGGSARAFAHLGVIKVLEEAGIRPDLVVGTSAGAIVGGLYAAGKTMPELEHLAGQMDMLLVSDLTLPKLGLRFLPGELGLIRGERLQQWINHGVDNQSIEQFPIPFAVVATDLQSGTPAIFNAGDAGLAVRASVAVPGAFVPAEIDGRLYVDGQLVSPVPVTAARQLGAAIVIAVDVTFPTDHADLATPVSVLFHSFTIATQRVKAYELGLASIVITPVIKSAGRLTFSDREWVMRAGEDAAREALPKLKKLLGKE